MTTSSQKEFLSIGIDIGKDVFHLVGFDPDGKIVLRKKIKRLALGQVFEKLPPSVIGMEACMSAHFVSRALRRLGHDPKILPAFLVKPFVKGQKNDYNDAEAIAEAVLRPNLRPVREKTQAQLDLQAMHRVRDRLVSKRTATINQIRALLIERGIAVRSGAHALRTSLFPALDKHPDEISSGMRDLITGLYEDWLWLDERVEQISGRIEEISNEESDCERLKTVPGIGPIISTAIVAAIGRGEAFERGRDFAAWLGLIPRQYSTGGRTTLGGISKRGNRHLRMLFVQAARVILLRSKNWENFSFGPWLKEAAGRLHHNKLAVALANKLARITWSVLHSGKEFDGHKDAAMAI